MIRNKKTLCFGEVLWDMLPTGAKPGGAPMNVALHLHRIGAEVGLVAKVGDDYLGEKLLDFIREFGLNTSLIQVDRELATSQVIVHLDANKNANYEICENVAWDNVEFTPDVDTFSQEAGIVVYGTLASRFHKTRQTLFAVLDNSDAYKVIDVNLRAPYTEQGIVDQLLDRADLIKVNEEELPLIAAWHNVAGDDAYLMKWMAKTYNASEVCVTKGAKGALLLMNGEIVSHPGFTIELVDSVGAGDAFLGGLISAIIGEKTPQEAITYACAVGAYVASKEGATPDYDNSEIEEILKQSFVTYNLSR